MAPADEPMDRREFVQQLITHVPEAEAEVLDHLEYYDEVLLHLLMSELLRLTVRLFQAGDLDVEQRLLAFIALAFMLGDDDVVNAVAVSFVEGVGASPEETPEYIASWPRALLDELARQRAGFP